MVAQAAAVAAAPEPAAEAAPEPEPSAVASVVFLPHATISRPAVETTSVAINVPLPKRFHPMFQLSKIESSGLNEATQTRTSVPLFRVKVARKQEA
jgi:hypothetical protein